jgi:hypothetical protein
VRGAVAVITLNRPEALNAVTYDIFEALRELRSTTSRVCPGVRYLWAMSNVAPEPYQTMARDGGYPQRIGEL